MSISVYFVLIATFSGFLSIKKVIKTKYIYFIWFLLFTLTIEITAFFLKSELNINPKPIYNLYAIFLFLFYFLFYQSIFRKKRNIKLMNVFIFLHLSFVIFNHFVFNQNVLIDMMSNAITFSAVLLILTLILFLIEIINNEKIVFNINKSLIFWISIGALLFYGGSIPVFISAEYLQYEGLYYGIINTLNFIMYGCFTLGMVISDSKYNY